MKDFLIDTHAHLFLEDFDDDIEDVLDRMIKKNIHVAIMPNIDLNSIEKNIFLQKKYSKNLFSMIGIHPCYVGENYKEDLKILEKYLSEEKFIAIGEVGIDLYHQKKNFDLQKKALEIQIDFAKSIDLPISIHARDSIIEVFDILKKNKNQKLRGIIHCYSGDEKQMLNFFDLNFSIGIGGTLTYKNNSLVNFLKKDHLDRIVLETDCPYLSPLNFRNKRNEPSFMYETLKRLSEVLELDLNFLQKKIFENTKIIFDKINFEDFFEK